MVAVSHQTAVGSGLTVDTVLDQLQHHHHHQAVHHHGLQHYSSDTSDMTMSETNLDNLYPALVQCFGIILLGFTAGKFSIISDVEAKGKRVKNL